MREDLLEDIYGTLRSGKSVVLVGPRQVGKTTVLSGVCANMPGVIHTEERNIGTFTRDLGGNLPLRVADTCHGDGNYGDNVVVIKWY